MSYSSFPGQSPSGGEFGFPRLSGTPDRQKLGLEFLQRPSSGASILNSPPSFISPRAVLGIPPLPIFQPSPMRASQGITYLSPDAKGKRRQSDMSEFQRFSMSPGYQGQANNASNGIHLGEGKNCLTSAFADILDGHSRVSPKHFTVKAGPKSEKKETSVAFWKDGMIPVDLNNASNSPLQLNQDISTAHDTEEASQKRKSLDFSNIIISPLKGQNMTRAYPQSPELPVMENLLPIHPLESRSREMSPEKSTQRYSYSHSHTGLNTSTQSPMGAKIGLIRREDIIDSPAVKEAADAAVAAAMRANSFVCDLDEFSLGLKRPQRAAAAGVAAAAAAAAAAATGGMKGKRGSSINTFSMTSKRSEDAIFMSTSIPGMGTTAPTKCKCKKSKCLKLYCECFKARGYCGDDCSCEGCSNKPGCDDEIENARETILTRNPHAFAGKIAETVVPSQDGLMTSGAQHTKGCNCKKSKCQKKYCECFQAGVPCGNHCKCNGCANTAQHYDTICSKGSSMSDLVQQSNGRKSIPDGFLRSWEQKHPRNVETMRKMTQQSAKSDVSTLIPVDWAAEPPYGNFSGRAEVINGLTPIAPQNLEIKTDKEN